MNKKRIEEFLDINTTGVKLDKLMKEMLQEKFDKELKIKYQDKLAREYNVHRTEVLSNKPKSSVPKYLYMLLFMMTGLAIGYFALKNLSQNSNSNKENTVEHYLAENKMPYQGATRSDHPGFNKAKSNVYVSFNQSDYKTFLADLSAISDLSKEDFFFRGYANMRLENYTEALQDFEFILKSIEPHDKYYEELLLYKAICLRQSDEVMFKKFYQKLNKSSWAIDELKKIDTSLSK